MDTKETIVTVFAILVVGFVLNLIAGCEVKTRMARAHCIENTPAAEVLKCKEIY